MKKLARLKFNDWKICAIFLIGLAGTVSIAQCPETNGLTIPSEHLNSGYDGGSNFNSLIIGNYSTGSGGTDGRLLVGGNFTLNNSGGVYKVGVTSALPVNKDNFIVNGQLINSSGGEIQVRGNFKYGSLGVNSALPTHATGEGTNTNATGLINFTTLKQHYDDLSTDYSELPTINGSSESFSNGILTLSGNNTVANYVFNVTLPEGEVSEIIYQNIPVGSGILVNILNNIVNLAASTLTTPVMVTTHSAKTLFNFPNAETVYLEKFNLEGGILAPKANFYASSGLLNGPAVIGRDMVLAVGFSFKNTCFSYPLPVKLASFSVKREGTNSFLKWRTTAETNAEKFVVERAGNSKKWVTIGEVAARGESIEELNYSHTDGAPLAGSNLYRIKMVDNDGSFAYSRIVSLNFKGETLIKMYPNPVADKLMISADASLKIADVEITDFSGKRVAKLPYDGKDIDVKNLAAGVYVIKLTELNGGFSAHKFIKY